MLLCLFGRGASRKLLAVFGVLAMFMITDECCEAKRMLINLDGQWDIAQGKLDTVPREFSTKICSSCCQRKE